MSTFAASLGPAPVDTPPAPAKKPEPSTKPVPRNRLTAQLDPITVKYYPGNRSYIVVGAAVTVKNASQQALQMAVHSLSLKLGDGTTLRAKKVEGVPFCSTGPSLNCERKIRRTEAISPDGKVVFNVEFSEAVGAKAQIGRTGTAILSGAMWMLDAEGSDAELTQSSIHVAGVEQAFMLD